MAIAQLGGYRVLERLGKGSIGTVYRCSHEATGQVAAIRMLAEGIRWDPELRRQLAAECRSIARLRHPNISALQDFGEENGIAYTVSEFLEGRSLESLTREEIPMPVEAAVSLMIQATEGLAFAHDQGIVHLDLRPGNLHLTPGGALKVCDFGIGRLLLVRTSPPAIRWGSRIYLSPEQIEGKTADARSDIFSLGLVFYELLTFTHPFHDMNSSRALDHILFKDQMPAIEKHPHLPLGLWPLLDRCLAKNPGDRHQTMGELRTAARQLLEDITEDSRLMEAEIQALLPRLRDAATRSEEPAFCSSLLREAENLNSKTAKSDYLSLNRLLADVSTYCRSVQAVRVGPAGPDLSVLARFALEADRTPPRVEAKSQPAVPMDPAPEPAAEIPSEIVPACEPACDRNLQLPALETPPPEIIAESTPTVSEAKAPAQPHQGKLPRSRRFRMTLAAASLLLAGFVWMGGGAPERLAETGGAGLEDVSSWVGRAGTSRARPMETDRRHTVRVLLHQARLLKLEGRYAEGRLFLARVLELDPENAEAKALRARIEVGPVLPSASPQR